MTTVVVASVTSESKPPITPATATGFSPFVMTKFVAFSVRSFSSNVLIASPSVAKRTAISPVPNWS